MNDSNITPSPTSRFTQLPVTVESSAFTTDEQINILTGAVASARFANEKLQKGVKPLEKASKKFVALKKEYNARLQGEYKDKQGKTKESDPKKVRELTTTLQHLQSEIKRHESTVEISENLLGELTAALRGYENDFKKVDSSDPKIKKMGKLIDSLRKEISKQDELEIKKIEAELSKIAGNKIFNSIFRIKSVPLEDPRLGKLVERLEVLKNKRNPHLENKLQKLELQLGRALMIGHGFRNDKEDLHRFLTLSPERMHEVGVKDLQIMIRYVAYRFPTKNLEGTHAKVQILRAEELLKHKGENLSKLDTNGLLDDLSKISRSHPLYEKAQKFRVQVHALANPNYLEEVERQVKSPTVENLDEHLEMLDQYRKYHPHKDSSRNLWGALFLKKNPTYLLDGRKLAGMINYPGFREEDHQGTINDYIKHLALLENYRPSRSIANEAHTLKRFFEAYKNRDFRDRFSWEDRL